MILFAGALVTACAGGGDVPGADALSVRGEAHVYQKLAQATALSVRGAGMSSDKVLSCEVSEADRIRLAALLAQTQERTEKLNIVGRYSPAFILRFIFRFADGSVVRVDPYCVGNLDNKEQLRNRRPYPRRLLPDEAYREYMRIIGKYIPSYMEWKEVSVKEYRAVYDEAWGR